MVDKISELLRQYRETPAGHPAIKSACFGVFNSPLLDTQKKNDHEGHNDMSNHAQGPISPTRNISP